MVRLSAKNRSFAKSSLILALALVFLPGALGCYNRSGNNNNSNSSSPSSSPSSPSAPAKTGSTKKLAWDMGSKLSLAALGNGRGANASAVESVMGKAKDSAQQLGVEIPPLPDQTGDTTKDSAAALHYLLKTAGDPIASKLRSKYDDAHAALFEMALKSNVLMLLYSPGDSTSKTIAGVIKNRGTEAGLPESLWKPVVDKIEEQAPFDEVKAAVSQMHQDVLNHLE